MDANNLHEFISTFKNLYPNHFIHERKGNHLVFWDAPQNVLNQSRFIAIWMNGCFNVSFDFTTDYYMYRGLEKARSFFFEKYRLENDSWRRVAPLMTP
jgi:hypothetical protein